MRSPIDGEELARAEWDKRRLKNPIAASWEELDEETRSLVIASVNRRTAATLYELQRRHHIDKNFTQRGPRG